MHEKQFLFSYLDKIILFDFTIYWDRYVCDMCEIYILYGHRRNISALSVDGSIIDARTCRALTVDGPFLI